MHVRKAQEIALAAGATAVAAGLAGFDWRLAAVVVGAGVCVGAIRGLLHPVRQR